MIFFVLVTILGAASAANVICTDYGKDIGGGGGAVEGYYVRPVPKNCRMRHLGHWSPQFRIREPIGQCPGGWRKWKGKCYFGSNNGRNWRDAEQHCNRHQGHMWQPNDREEYQWVEQNVMRRNAWHWLGTICNSQGRNSNLAAFYTASGEDMRKIQQRLNARMHPGHHIDNESHPCMLSHRNNNSWRWQYHHQHCHEGHRYVCESPLG